MNRKQRRSLKAIGAPLSLPEKSPEDQLKEEYYQACAEAGELQFKIKQFEAGLQAVNQKIAEVNKRYVELKEPKDATA